MSQVNCPVPSVITGTPEYKTFKEKFGSAVKNNDDLLLHMIDKFREDNGLENTWYPVTEEDNQKFSDFIQENKPGKRNRNKSLDELKDLYEKMYTVFTPQQLRERIDDVVYRFWDCVNRLEKNDKKGKDRTQLIQSYKYNGKTGYKAILDYIFDQYDEWATETAVRNEFIKEYKKRNNTDEVPENVLKQIAAAAKRKADIWQPVVENREMLSALSINKIGEIEGFVVRINGLQVDLSETSEEDFTDGFTEDNGDEDGNDDSEGTKGDRYSDYRTTKLMEQLSAECRRILFGIPQKDATGRIVMTDMFTPKLLDIRKTAVALKVLAVNSTPQTFLDDIKNACVEKPWLLGVWDRLHNNHYDTAVVYSALKGNTVTYCTTLLEDGSYKTIIVNSKARGKQMMAHAGNAISGGLNGYDEGYSITDYSGKVVSAEKLQTIREGIGKLTDKISDFAGTISMLDDSTEYEEGKKKAIKKLVEKYGGSADDYNYLLLEKEEAMRAFLDKNPDVPAELARYLRGMGFEVTAKNIYDSALQSLGTYNNAKKFWDITDKQNNANKLYGTAVNARKLIDRAIQFQKKNADATGADLYSESTQEFSKVTSYVALSVLSEVEPRVVSQGKSLQAITNVNLLHQTFDKLNKMSKEDIAQKILPYEGMGLGYGDNIRPTGWLNGYTDKLRVYDSLGFNNREYGKMSVQQKMTNAILNYFMSPSWIGGTLYEVCIQSDYETAYNFISGPRFDKEKLIDMASDEVLVELERITAIQDRIKNYPDRIKYDVYERNGQKIHIFPELNSNGFIKEYNDAKDNVGPDEALKVLKRHVAEQFDKIAARDAEYYSDRGIFKNQYLKYVPTQKGDKAGLNFYSENGTFDGLDEKAKDAFLLMSMNYYYARQQITKLTVGDLSHFDGLSDFEKRNMLIHAPHTSLYTRGDMTFNGNEAGITSQNVAYVDDDKQKSAYLEYNEKALTALYNAKKITKAQLDRMLKNYENIKTTDGTGMRTLDSKRRLCIAAGNWSGKQEDAYHRIMKGEATSSDIDMFFNPDKPVYTGYDEIPAVEGDNQKPIRVTVLHKYAEVILLPESLAGTCIQAMSTPMRALSRAAEENGIDMMLFTSGVKVGAFSVLKPFAKTDDGQRILTSEDDIVQFISNEIKTHPSAIHTLDLEGYGIAASIAAHGEDDKISISTQAEKEGFADIEPGEMAEIDGQKVENEQLRTIYYQTKAADTMELYDDVRELFKNSSELQQVLKDELQTKSYYSREMVFAIEQLKDGGTAMPLFSPGIRHNVEQLLASIINKRLTKPRFAGSNMPEATAFGIDMDSAPFEDSVDFPKLEVVYEEGPDGLSRQYIEVYMPIYDSAFEAFADENGAITPEQLWGKDGLVARGIILKEALEFIAYRTPSDYTHSLFNCRIKGFIAKTGGQVLYMPKECMVPDGHDYDGDKKRCHFPSISFGWDEDKLNAEYDALDDAAKERLTREAYIAYLKSSKNPERLSFRKITYDKYDFSKTAKENSMTQRYNGRIRMLFSVLASPAGTSRALIPGEFEETKVMAKAMYIIRNLENATGGIRNLLTEYSDPIELYNYLTSLSDSEITKYMNELNANVSPFSMEHAADSYEYIMEPADMIGIYAMYGSTAMMLQRANLYYEPKKTEKGGNYDVNIFDHKIDRFYEVRDRNGNYASMGRSHLLCAAVDNPKDAILGFLNQKPELASITNFLQAAGYSEEDIHLLMNQPAIIELSNRLSSVGEDYTRDVINDELEELTRDISAMKNYVGGFAEWNGLKKMATIKKEDCINMLSIPYSRLTDPDTLDEREKQIALLLTFRHLLKPAQDLTEFVRLVRPESVSGSIGTEVSDAIMKKRILEDFRDRMSSGDDFRLGGVQSIIQERGLNDDLSETQLPEVIALNTAIGDNALDLFKAYFPEVRGSWTITASTLMDYYNLKSKKQKSRRMSKIVYEMVLWKLLNSGTGFVTEEIKDDQTRVLKETPYKVAALKNRINKVQNKIDHKDVVTDTAAKKLIGNQFLGHLYSDVNNAVATRRLRFELNGPAIEGIKDDITAGWNQLMMSDDADIRQLAIDLFKYNVFSNGLQYGMYEFSHFVPFSVLVSTPGYIAALQNMMNADFIDYERQEFIEQYFMNHWNDKKFLNRVKLDDVTKEATLQDGNIILPSDNDSEIIGKLTSKPFVIIRSGEDNKVQTLFRLGFDGTHQILAPVAKLGYRAKKGNQLTLQYNPQVKAVDMTPIISPTREYQGKTEKQVSGDADYENGPDTSGQFDSFVNQMNGANNKLHNMAVSAGLAAFGLAQQKAKMKEVETKAEEAKDSNKDIPTENEVREIEANVIPASYDGFITPSENTIFVFGSNPEGRHGAGAAKVARDKFGAIYGQGEGLQGNAYALPTKDLRVKENNGLRSISPEQITENIKRMYDVATENPNKEFKVAYTNGINEKTLNGYTGAEMIQMFKDAGPIPANVIFSKNWTEHWNEVGSTENNTTDNSQDEKTKKALGAYMKQFFNIAHRNDDGTVTIDKVPATPDNIREARKQKVYVELNKKLRDILREKGVAVGVLDDAEARLALGGVTDFDTAQVTAEGLLELIRIAEGYHGEEALPEEFAHVAIEMIGYDNPLVQRLLAALRANPSAMQEAFGSDYAEYVRLYGNDMEKLTLEAAGKLVAKQLFRQQEIETAPVRSLIRRIVDAIKDFFRKWRRDEIQNAIFEVNNLASKVAKGMFGGKLIDIMSLDNISKSGKFFSTKNDLSGKHDVLSKLLKIEAKRLSILKKRLGPDADTSKESSVAATQMQVAKLESAIENYKTEDAIITYMNDSLGFLAKTEEALDNAVNAGKKANDICKRLNTVRDTLFSFSQALDAVNDAIIDGEITDTHMISESMGKVQEVISRFYVKYERIAKQYFEEMLSNVYGESGVTVGIGKDKGRVISIKEMARKADSDIGFMSRWFHSIADCNDYVLMAVDDITRRAKMRGRARLTEIRPRVEKAVNDLIAETGSRDTTFMFEKKHYDGQAWCNGAEDDGKLHKTGYYIKKDSIQYKNLSPAQKAFYDTFMDIKKMADGCVPESLLKDGKIIMLRKYTLQRVKDAEGIGNKFLTAWDGIKNSVLEMSDDYDPEYEEVAVDFENNKVDRLPLKFLLRGKNEQYDDMTDDVASSLMAYAGMAFEYDEVNGVINELENAKYMASERQITQRTGMKTKRESIDTDPDKDDSGLTFREPFTKKAIDSNAQKALEDFFQMHLYGHIHKAEGTFGTTRISKRKTVDTLNNITSLTQMAINLPQRIANINTGMTQILIETRGKGHFNFKDLMWAIRTYIKETGDRMPDLGKTDYDNKLSLFADKFDLHQNNGRNQTNYAKSNISRIINSSLLYAGLTAGEDALALTTSLAIAKNYKVKGPDGKVTNLFDAYTVKYTDNKNKTGAYLALKSGYTMEDGSPISTQIEEKYAKECAAMNFEMQGIYNLDDRSAIQQYAAGSLLIMYRKWIAPSIKRRYGNAKFNALKGEYEEGYHRTMIRFLWDSVMDAKNSITEQGSATKLLNIYADIKAFNAAVAMNWDKLSDYEKSNVRRAQMEIEVVTGLYLACALSGKVPPRKKEDDPNYKPTWWDRQVMSQLFRLRSEIGSQAPTPMMVNEALHIMRSPFAAMGPITSTLNGFKLLIPSTYFTDIKSGRYKGHTKAYKYFRELPIIAAYKKIENFIDPTPLINYYKNEIVY